MLTRSQVMWSARNHTRVSAWRAADRPAYHSAVKRGWLTEATVHMLPVRRVATPHRLTDEAIVESALTCKTRSEWASKFSRQYQAARERLGVFDRCVAHMPTRGKKKPRVIFEPMAEPAALGTNRAVWVIAGVSGSGKSWVCEQLTGVCYVRADDATAVDKDGARFAALFMATQQPLPIVYDPTVHVTTTMRRLPFITFNLVVIAESIEVVQQRLRERGSLQWTLSLEQRWQRVRALARRAVFSGTSVEVLAWVQTKLNAVVTP